MMSSPNSPVDVRRFLRAVEETNPFQLDAVDGIRGAEVDVGDIHKREFERITRQVEIVRAKGGSVGILLLAPAGIGKSHLLARLDRWSREEARSTMITLHNLVAAPSAMARAVLAATVRLLAGAREFAFAQSDLYAILNRAVCTLHGDRGAPPVPTRLALLREAAKRFDPERTVFPALESFLASTIETAHGSDSESWRAQLAVEWLSGQRIDSDAAEAIGLRGEGGDTVMLAEGMEERVLAVLAGLSALSHRPLILCLDQVDNLEAETIKSLARFVHTLVDHANNLVVVTSGVKSEMLRLHAASVIPDAAWDRMARISVELLPVLSGDAKKIVTARVEQFIGPFRQLAALEAHRRKDPLFPLGTTELDAYLERAPEHRPRDVIKACRDRWSYHQMRLRELGDQPWLDHWGLDSTKPPPPPPSPPPTEELIDKVVDSKVKELVSERRLKPERLPASGDRLKELVRQLLGLCRDNPAYTLVDFEVCSGKASAYDLWVTEKSEGREVLNGVTFIVPTSANPKSLAMATTNALKSIVNATPVPAHRIVVTLDEKPLRLGPKGNEYLKALSDLGSQAFTHIELKIEDYALLDSLLAVPRLAKSDELEIETGPGQSRAITEKEAERSLHRGQWFLRSKLLAELLTEEPRQSTNTITPSKYSVSDVEAFLRKELSWRILFTAREAAAVYVELHQYSKDAIPSAWRQIKEIALAMAQRGVLGASASGDDLVLTSSHAPTTTSSSTS
ncbi:MAG: hypothetical protein ABTD50_20160 [Polyangiaceae bacterium]|jgi:hypothetical protein